MEGESTAATAQGSDAVALLRRLLRINTVNPPGNEEPAQELLAETLTAKARQAKLLSFETELGAKVQKALGK